jgi:hypothetical protein
MIFDGRDIFIVSRYSMLSNNIIAACTIIYLLMNTLEAADYDIKL